MKKFVLQLDFHDENCRQKVMKTASGISGVEPVAMDKDQKLIVTGDIDPVKVKAVRKLRKLCHTEIVSVGQETEPEKKKEELKKEQPKEVTVTYPYGYHPSVSRYPPYVYHPLVPRYSRYYPLYTKTVEEDPTSCIIC